MVSGWIAVLTGLIGVLASATGTVWVTKLMERNREPALIARLTAAAVGDFQKSYDGLLDQYRQDVSVSRQLAHDAQMQASQALTRAMAAELRAAKAEAQLAEFYGLVRRYVPNAEELLRDWEQLLAANQVTPHSKSVEGSVLS